MTAMLKNIRELDARLKRGDLTPEQYEARREAVLQSADIVDTLYEPVDPPARKTAPVNDTPRHAPNAIGLSIVICLSVMGLSVALILLFLPDLNLALTLGVTLLAALSVALFRALDD